VTAGTTQQPASVHVQPGRTVDVGRVVRLWWPLAASWLLMGAEMPLLSAVVARMADPEIHLAAYGSTVLPLSLMVEAPIIMLLAASTALSRDWPSYVKLRNFTLLASCVLTALHVAIAFTPLFTVVARDWIGIPPEVVEPARTGLRIMTPWTLAIAYRRFQQGVLVRFERTRVVGAGTAVRLAVNAAVLGAGWWHGGFPGIVVGTSAVIAGVVAEAVFISLSVRETLREHLASRTEAAEPWRWGRFAAFYVPLAIVPALTLAIHPLAAATMARMPDVHDSLAAWAAVAGLTFLLRSPGFAYSEVVVALLGGPGGRRALARFAGWLVLVTSALIALLVATPLAGFVFGELIGLPAGLVPLSRAALAFGLLLPALSVVQNSLQGALVHAHRTRGVTEAVVVYVVGVSLAFGAGIVLDPMTGIHWIQITMTLGVALQCVWLWRRARGVLAAEDAA
jgi:hypothetical protein